MKKRTALILLSLIFLLGIFLRGWYIFPNKIIFGYDQVIDTIIARKIVDNHDIVIQGIGANALGLNHGVLFNYFTAIPYFIGGGSVMTIAYWYLSFSALAIGVIYLFSFNLFKSRSQALISSFLMAFSYQTILMAGWISNTTVALYLTPLFYLGFLLYKKGRSLGLIMAAFICGLLIQSQMLMVYNLAVIPLIWWVLKLKRPNLKTILISLSAFLLAVSTMVATEIKTNFSSLKVFLKPSEFLNESSMPFWKRIFTFGQQFLLDFSQNLTPHFVRSGVILGVVVLLVMVGRAFYIKTKKEEKNSLVLLLIYLVSPIFMTVVGYHDTPWTLIGIIPAVFVAVGYVISKIPFLVFRILILSLFFWLSMNMLMKGSRDGELFINQEASSTLKGQLAVIDYTYQAAGGKNFAINAVTYPLYENTYWSYHYPWYGLKKYGYLPTWLGGDQLYPYNTLPKATGQESIFYMITDETQAIPAVHKLVGRQWGSKYGKLLEEKVLGGFTVQKFQKLTKSK